MSASPASRFGDAYARLRAMEGRGAGGEEELYALPYLREGPLAKQWEVRARTFEAWVRRCLAPLERSVVRPLRILDLGAGNGWLSGRLVRRGHRAVALDLRVDRVDGLGAAAPFGRVLPTMFGRVAASFDAIPLRGRLFDVVLFNAALHYAADLAGTLVEAVKVAAPGGRIVILDSPFYNRAEAGEEMVREKRVSTAARFGFLSDALLEHPSIEYLTPRRLHEAARPVGLDFHRHRVIYPLWYEARAAISALRRRRPPSRFDIWEASLP